MTTHYVDLSNHDWGRGPVDVTAMAAAGITGGWHKTTDGLRFYLDPYWPAGYRRLRALGCYGSYHVLWGDADLAGQVHWWFAVLDDTAPGWRSDPRFLLMTDNEPFGYNQAPSVEQVNRVHELIRAETGKTALAYCPPWWYGPALARLAWPLVSSNYGTNPAVGYRDGYPGDNSPRWAAACPVDLLQYGSRLSVAGQPGCDVNALRGDLTALLTLTGGAPMTSPWDEPEGQILAYRLRSVVRLTDPVDFPADLGHDTEPNRLAQALRQAGLRQAALDAKFTALDVKLTALDVKTTALDVKLTAVADALTALPGVDPQQLAAALGPLLAQSPLLVASLAAAVRQLVDHGTDPTGTD